MYIQISFRLLISSYLKFNNIFNILLNSYIELSKPYNILCTCRVGVLLRSLAYLIVFFYLSLSLSIFFFKSN